MKTIEDHIKYLLESNQLIKMLILTEIAYHKKNKNKIVNELVEERSFEFIEFRDGNINPKEVLKNQTNFKSNLGKMKKGNPN